MGLIRMITKLLDGLARGDKPGADAPRRLKPGTVLVREYQGERHTVTVVPDGYLWREATYASLSTIARAITGTAWNGPRFFGLRSCGNRLQGIEGERARRPMLASADAGRSRRRGGSVAPLPRKAQTMKPSERKVFRCAIYTRKSTEHNLDLEFNSLDAQREACEAYIKSQAHEGWRLIPDRYDDGGLSGASLDRPALQKLLADVRAGKINTVVVYKVDRLTRSLADFAKLVELFDQHGVSFVSITQSFNTTSSMGRLTLNVLLSFAQFEREVIGERVRDKIAASKRKGIWVGGPVPLGYRCIDKKLVVVPEEAETVRTIFTRYLALGSMGALIAGARSARHPDQGQWPSRRPPRGAGSASAWDRSPICSRTGSTSVRWPIGASCIAASMTPILDRDLFEAVQAKLAANAVARQVRRRGSAGPSDRPHLRRPRQPHEPVALQQARRALPVLCVAGDPAERKAEAGSVARVPAPEIETLVLDGIRKHLASMGKAEHPTTIADRDLIERYVESVIVKPQALEVRLVPHERGIGSSRRAWRQPPGPRPASDHHTGVDRSKLRRRKGHRSCTLRKAGTEGREPRCSAHRNRQGTGMDRRHPARSNCLLRRDCQA